MTRCVRNKSSRRKNSKAHQEIEQVKALSEQILREELERLKGQAQKYPLTEESK